MARSILSEAEFDANITKNNLLVNREIKVILLNIQEAFKSITDSTIKACIARRKGLKNRFTKTQTRMFSDLYLIRNIVE
jgi:hypothetical protein